jgi:hypothetical protein
VSILWSIIRPQTLIKIILAMETKAIFQQQIMKNRTRNNRTALKVWWSLELLSPSLDLISLDKHYNYSLNLY